MRVRGIGHELLSFLFRFAYKNRRYALLNPKEIYIIPVLTNNRTSYMGLENFNATEKPKNNLEDGTSTPEEIATLEAEALQLSEEASNLQSSIANELPACLENIESRPNRRELHDRLFDIQQSWQKVKERAIAIAAGSVAFGAFLNLAAPVLENPNISVSDYEGAVDGKTWIFASIIAINAIGLAANKLKHAMEESGIREELKNI